MKQGLQGFWLIMLGISLLCAVVLSIAWVGSMSSDPQASWPRCEAHGIIYHEVGCAWTARETDRLESGEGQ